MILILQRDREQLRSLLSSRSDKLYMKYKKSKTEQKQQQKKKRKKKKNKKKKKRKKKLVA